MIGQRQEVILFGRLRPLISPFWPDKTAYLNQQGQAAYRKAVSFLHEVCNERCYRCLEFQTALIPLISMYTMCTLYLSVYA